jgi:RNA polymerase subunit RPABC4/transcription elongation factor Spt4
MDGLIEKTICLKCGIVFEKAIECPRCGSRKDLDIYLETKE